MIMNKKDLEFWEKFYKIRYCPSLKNEQADWEIDFVKKFLPQKKYINILDFICGFGRHAIKLAEIGYNIEGFDIDKESIERAKKQIGIQKLRNIKLYCQDVLKFNQKKKFDATICLYSSIGFLDEQSNKIAFENLFESVKDDGRIILDVMNPDWAIKYLIPYTEKRIMYQDCKYFVEHYRTILHNPVREKNTIQFIKDNNLQKRTISYILRLYSYKELENMFNDHGFEIYKSFGSFFKPNNISADNQRIIIVADKK